MACEVSWYDPEHTILIVTITKDTTWTDYHNAIDVLVAHAAATDQRIDAVFYDNVGMPAGNPMPHIKKGVAKIMSQPNFWLALIAGTRGSSGFVRIIIETLARAIGGGQAGNRPMFFRTLEDAIAYIREDRAKNGTGIRPEEYFPVAQSSTG
ncbi:MAG: hypothetical protein R3E39_29635 [Anaerolineae bacterium]